jgi:hypothetical protein
MTTKIFGRFTNLAKRDFRGTAELFKMLNAQKMPPHPRSPIFLLSYSNISYPCFRFIAITYKHKPTLK